MVDENEIKVWDAREPSSPLVYRQTYRDFSGQAGKLVYFDQGINFSKPDGLKKEQSENHDHDEDNQFLNDELVDDDDTSSMPPARSKRLPLFQIATAQEGPSPGVTAVAGHFLLLEDDKMSLLETSKNLSQVDTLKFSDKARKLVALDAERGLIFRFRESAKCLIAYVV